VPATGAAATSTSSSASPGNLSSGTPNANGPNSSQPPPTTRIKTSHTWTRVLPSRRLCRLILTLLTFVFVLIYCLSQISRVCCYL
jgi:hypothetical protein